MKDNSTPNVRTRVFRNLTALMAVRGLNLIVPVITIPYILRVIGLDNYGLVAFSTLTATFAGSIIQYGFAITGVRSVASARHDPGLLAQTFWGNFHANFLIGLCVCAVYIAVILGVPTFREMLPLYIGAILLSMSNALFPHWLFLGMERSYYVAITTLIVRILYLFLIVILIREPSDFVLINYIGAGTSCLNIGIAFFIAILIFKIPPVSVSVYNVIKIIRNDFPSFLLQWTPNIYNSASSIILGFFVSPSTLGAFNVAQTVVTLIISVGQLLANAFLPIMSAGFDRHKLASTVLLITGCLAGVLVFFLAPFGAILLADSGHAEISRDLRYLSLSIPFVFGYYAYGHNYVALTEARNPAGRITLCISLFGLALSFILVPYFKSAGVASVLLISRAGMFLMAYLLYRSHNVLIKK